MNNQGLPGLPGALVFHISGYLDNPMTLLSMCCACKELNHKFEDLWIPAMALWSKRFAGGAMIGNSTPTPFGLSAASTSITSTLTNYPQRRSSCRLQEREYYSPKKQFIRLLENAATHAVQIHTEIFSRSMERKELTTSKLKSMMYTFAPVWVNCGGRDNTNTSRVSSVLVEALRARCVTHKHALGICKELVENWGAHVDALYGGDGMRPVIVAAARGFPDAVEYLMKKGCEIRSKSKGSFMVRNKKIVSGTYTAHDWSRVMLEAERECATPENELKRLQRCFDLTS